MPTPRRRLSRKELKQPDEFTTFIEGLEEFVASHTREAIVAVAIVIGLALIVFGLYSYERHRDHLAANRFYQAFSELNSKQYRNAERDFISLAADEPGREVGRLSRLYLGACYLAENDLNHARDALVAYLPDAHDLSFRALALMDLGTVYEKQADLKKAQGVYQQASALPGAAGLDAQLALARIQRQAMDTRGAIATYQRFLQEHPFAPQRQDVIEELARLGVSAETSSSGARASR
jgi:tetratricopeptide (TPR) repeat protein